MTEDSCFWSGLFSGTFCHFETRLELRPLNILIGENTAGKSNVIEAIGLLQAMPQDFRVAILRGGGARFWLWLGGKVVSPIATLGFDTGGVEYRMEFSEDARGLVILNERLAAGETIHYDRTAPGAPWIPGPTDALFAFNKSPQDPTPITGIGRKLEEIRVYREFQTGSRSGSRQGVSTGVAGDYLSDGGDNLALVLQDLNFRGVQERIAEYVSRLSDRIGDVRVKLDGSIAKAFLVERKLLEPLPSARMSDGTLKFLCLLAVLLHPDPPPLVCIEEPEQGLHPDAIGIVAQLLKDASERMQLVVTTHSEALIDAFSDSPEDVLVCERDEQEGTQCTRLSAGQLEHWLQRYSLGQLWRKGEIGGTRW